MTRVAIVVLAAAAAVAVVWSGFRMLDDRSAPPIVIADPRPDATIVVGVGGAVASPGVYSLAGDARAQDALAAAGGASADADLAAMNLARRLRDEDQLLVPSLAPTAAPAPSAPRDKAEGAPAAPTVVTPASVHVNLNTASPDELDTLPGIGPVLAQRIVDHRTTSGPFREVDELVEVQGISQRIVDELRPLITVTG